MRIDDDTTAHDLIIDQWQHVGTECRVIRSHRRPRSTRRGPAALVAAVTAVTLGITLPIVTSSDAPTKSVVAVQGGQFIESQPDYEILLTDEFIERRQREETASRSARVTGRAAKPEVKPKPKPRWVQPVKNVTVTSCYGPRWGSLHDGIDYDGETGDQIRSVGPGVVVQAGWQYSGYGYSVVVRHSDGWMSLYGHLSKVTARPGQEVSAGALVGLMGSTGYSTGSHLHLGIAKTSTLNNLFNSLVNPAPWLRSHGLAVSC